MINIQRRQWLVGLSSMAAAGFIGPAAALLPTPKQTAGPFYPTQLPLDDDNNLTEVKGKNGIAKGIISDLRGRIVDINGRALAGLRIEIWQCDANGRYRHPREQGSKKIDDKFQGHGATRTDASGEYRFRTIRPVSYPGRTPHIHIAVRVPSARPFVTQLYVAGEAGNERDFLYQQIPPEKRNRVTAEFNVAATSAFASGAELQAEFDIILHRRDGTPLQD